MTVVGDYRALLSNQSWTGTPGAAVVLTYSFSTAPTATVRSLGPAAAASFAPFTEAEKTTVRAALAAWADVSGITFEEVTATPGDLTFGFYDLSLVSGTAGEAGLGNYPNTGTYLDSAGAPQVYGNFLPQGGDVYFDRSYQVNPAYIADFTHLALHEIGHALGLKHPFDETASGPSYTLEPALDDGSETVMAYAGVRAATLGPLDVAAIQALYGTKTGAAHPFTQAWNAATESLTVTGGGGAAQALFGSGGGDVFYSLGPRDALAGGEGDDTFYLAGQPAGVNGGTGRDTVVTGLAYSALSTPVQGSGSGFRLLVRPARYSQNGLVRDAQIYVDIAVLDFTNGAFSTVTNVLTPYPDTLAWAGGTAAGWVLAGGAPGVLPGTGAADQVALTGAATPGAPAAIGTSGTAGSLNLNAGYATLSGRYALATLTIGSVGAAGLAVSSGGQLTTAGAALVTQVDTAAPALSVGAGGSVRVAALLLGGPPTVVLAGPPTLVLGGPPPVPAGVAGAATVLVAAGGTLEVGSDGVPVAGAVTVDAGAVLFGSGTIGGAVVNNGRVVASGGPLAMGPLSGSGTLEIAADGIAAVGGSLANAVAFAGTGGTLALLDPHGLQSGVVGGFAAGDTISIASAVGVTSAYYTLKDGLLSLGNAAGPVAQLHLAGAYPANLFTVTERPGGVADIGVTATDPLFDAAYYLARYPDVAAANVDPYAHYMSFGWHEARSPNAFFDTTYYLIQNSDVALSGINPLSHFEWFGWQEGRQPGLLFDDAAYLAANPDVAASGVDPLQHYLQSGRTEGRATFLTGGAAAPDPLVDAAYYGREVGASLIPAGDAGRAQAAWGYDHGGWQQGLDPDAFFDTSYYLAHNPDVAAAGVNPLLHYEQFGWHEGRDPSAAFSTSRYLAAYADVRAAGVDPLLHYVAFGQAEGRSAFAV